MESKNNQSIEIKALSVQTKAKDAVLKQLRLIITAILLLATLFYILIRVSRTTAKDDFIFNTIVGIALHIAMILIWIPAGKEKGEELPIYISNKTEAARRISDLLNNDNKLNMIDTYCSDVATEGNRLAKIKSILSKGEIKHSDYEKKYAPMSFSEIKKDKHLSFRQKRAILKVKRGVHVKQILSSSITSLDNKSEVIHDVTNHENGRQTYKVLTKVVFNTLTSITIAFMSFSKADSIGMEQIAQFLIWTASVLVNIYTCRRIGILLVAIQRNTYHLRLIDFCARYDAWLENNKDTPIVK